MAAPTDSTEYVLGTGQDERERLDIQHRVWSDVTKASWMRAQIGPGSVVLDLGSGPGHASFDLAQLVTPSGKILAVDESENFVGYLNHQARVRGLFQLRAVKGNAEDLPSTLESKVQFDAVYCRWLLCWLHHPDLAIRGIIQVLKPGGRLVIHDYFNWSASTMAPRSSAIDKMVSAALASFADRGGDIDIVARLPRLLRQAGFQLKEFQVHQVAARGGGADAKLAWPLSWWRSYGPKLVAMGRLTASEFALAAKDLDALEADPDRFMFCPPLFELIAVKI